MIHFLAILPKNTDVSHKNDLVDTYFMGINHKELYAFDDIGFQAKAWGHLSCQSVLHSSFQRKQYTFIGSARLDNFDELREDVAGPDEMQPSELILELFEKYQEKCFERLMGDFGFLVWDAENQQVWCVKDQIGIYPLFYFQQNHLTIFSSSIAAIRACVGIENLSINKKYLAKELKNYPVQVEETFFNEIHRLKPAHYIKMVLNDSRIFETRYWSFKPIDTSVFSTEEQVFDELRRLFTQAIKTRLHGVKYVATQLSGGLDSSAITVLASRIMPKENLHTFSFVLNEKTRAYSEQGIDEQVTQNSILDYAELHRENHHLSDGFYYQDTFACYDKSDEIMGGFADSDSIWQDSMYKQAAGYGVELIFSGFPGDEGISTPGGKYFFEYFHQKNWSWMIKEAIRHPYGFAKKCYHYFSSLYFKKTFRSYAKIQKGRNLLHPDSEFNAQLKDSSFSTTSSFRQDLINDVYRAHSCLRSESEGLYASQYGITTVYPMADLRFVQFALSLPVDYFAPTKHTRILFRKICEGILPDDVRLQKKYNGAMTLAFAEFWKKEQLNDFKDWKIKNSLNLFDPNKILDEKEFEQLIRKIVLNKMDYLIEKNLSVHDK